MIAARRPRGLLRYPALVLLLALLAFPRPAFAHKPSDAYLSVDVAGERVSGRLDVALRDLDLAVSLDKDADARVTWGEVESRYPAIREYVLAHVTISRGGAACIASFGAPAVAGHSDGAYLVLSPSWACPGHTRASDLTIRYDLLFDLDAQHRGLSRVAVGRSVQAFAFSTDLRQRRFELGALSRFATVIDLTREGTLHIARGYDHLLFLLALLLPSVLRREHGQWLPASDFRPVFFEVMKTATAFTVAHSLTLALAALDLVSLPARFVEAAIAASVLLAALNNLFPVIRADRWLVALPVGLLHGFGFAGALTDLGAKGSALVIPLLSFNLGVELGQVVLLATLLPIMHALRSFRQYPRFALVGGSAAIAVLSAVWLVERAFNVRVLG